MKFSECLPESMLRKSEWYNDFVLACGVRDILGARLVDTASYRLIFRYSSTDRPQLFRTIGFGCQSRVHTVKICGLALHRPSLSDQIQYDR
jgi:hypothetical protein